MDMATPEMPSREVLDPRNYSTRSPAVKRLLREAKELAEPDSEISAQPLDDNLFEWHFTIRGAPESDFERGIYHGRIILPAEYPMKPPSIILMTPNGRFETGTKICLSISSYHPETWQPSWSLRTALVALISFMTTDSPGAIGSLEVSSEARRNLARKSLTWVCPTCGPAIDHIKSVTLDKETMTQACTPKRNEDSPVVLVSNGSTPLHSESPGQAETSVMDMSIDEVEMDDVPSQVELEAPSLNVREVLAQPLGNPEWLRRENRIGDALYGFAIGGVVLGIVAILLRRLLIYFGFGDL